MNRTVSEPIASGRRGIPSWVGLLLATVACPAILAAASGRAGQPASALLMSLGAWLAVGSAAIGCVVHGRRSPISLTMLGLLVVAAGVPGPSPAWIITGVVLVAAGLVWNLRAGLGGTNPVIQRGQRSDSRSGPGAAGGSSTGS